MKVPFHLTKVLAFVALLAVCANANKTKVEDPAIKPQVEKEQVVGNPIEGSEELLASLLEEEDFSKSEETQEDLPIAEEKKCSLGRYVNGKFQGTVSEYDLQKILKKYGGPPGKVNATWSKKEDPPIKKTDVDKRPLPDADEKYWIYKYGDTDAKTYIRIEHAVRRFSGTPKAFLEVRGTMYFTPEDFCGKSRRAFYTVDDRGFTYEVTDEFCKIGPTVRCAPLASCERDEQGRIGSCSAPSSALLATLVGGGK